MDWIDPKLAVATKAAPKRGKSRIKDKRGKRFQVTKASKPLKKQVTAALAQPMEVWSSAYDHALGKLKWPTGCTAEHSFLWSAVIQEQAEVLVRAGMSAQKLASIVSEQDATTKRQQAEQLAEVVGLMDQSLESLAFHWLESADAYPDSALAVAGMAWHLHEHAARPGNEWLVQWLQNCLESMANYEATADTSALGHLVMQCELPLLIGVATSASKRTAVREANMAMDRLAELLEQSLDTPAPWLLHGATYLRSSLASVFRCRVLANSLGMRKWYPDQQKALESLLVHAARWCRPDGTQMLAAGNAAPRAKAMWRALVAQSKNSKKLSATLCLSGIGEGKRGEVRRTVSPARLPALSHYSPDACGASLQNDWRQRGCRLAIDFSDANICLEALGPKGESVLAGEWTAHVEVDGQAQLQLEEWEEVCWFSDDDCDYLELEARFGTRARVQRQAILLREERLLFLADALLCEQAHDLKLKSHIPLATDCKFQPAKKSTEGTLQGEAFNLLTLPLFLPEWRRALSQADNRNALTASDDDLLINAEGHARRLYTPMLISLCNSHAKQAFTWRQLTVADELRIVAADEAQAFRVQIGRDQWFFYRTLDKAVRRSALGMHLMSDFYSGRFDYETGELDEIIEVEADES